jgi:lactoylglutathione lyase
MLLRGCLTGADDHRWYMLSSQPSETNMQAAQDAEIALQQLVPLLEVRSMDASLQFYVEGLGFRMTNEWVPDGRRRWCWIEQGAVALMLQEVVPPERYDREFAGRSGIGVSLNFICRDAIAFFRLMRQRGIPAQRPFVGNYMWVTSLEDPDGFRLHFESPTDAPEETVYDG